MTDIRFIPYEGSGPASSTVKFAFDAEAVALLKDVVPTSGRTYNPEAKTWIVFQRYIPELMTALTIAGHRILLGDEPPPPTKRADGMAEFFTDHTGEAKAWADEILKQIPDHLRHRIFRELVKAMYPDLYPKRGKR